ncbi:MAG: SpaH/EbpB family LPXTG-anchored major pilin [Clostridia bacterium]|nr:SpaH/EbpB family LPXTG-anchored major pilin [Clostridia bacterium]
MKKLLASVLVILMAVLLVAPAFAENITPHVITITNSDTSVRHTYEAYQVFMGRLDATESEITNIEWGYGVDGDALLAELQTIEDYEDCDSAYDVAQVIKDFADNSAKLDEFASIVGKHLSNTSNTSVYSSNTNAYHISVTGDGYYFIKDRNASVTDPGESYSKYMLNVVKNVTIEAKDDRLVPDKKIVNRDSSLTPSNAAAIGETILFQIRIPVPKMDGYKAYTFTMNDTLSAGLCDPEVVSVTVGLNTLTEDEGYTVDIEENQDGTTSLTVDFINMIQYKGTSGYVVVTYEATVDEDAVIGDEGNPNTVDFTYSNNPSTTSEGVPGETPPDGGTTGTTPESETITYVTAITVEKVDGADNTKKLADATFQLEGDALQTVITTGVRYEAAPYTAQQGETIQAGTYYMLNNGTFTDIAPTATNSSHYASTTQTYVPVKYTSATHSGANVEYTATTGQAGIAGFSGLNAGTYTLTETLAPDGYNLLDSPINFTITWDATNGFAITSQNGTFVDNGDGTFSITIANYGGTPLPSTGGIGTTIFYIVGAVLVIGSGIVIVATKRAGKKEN